ncbi:class III extradiol ring-cleavage dioxygenase [uncultured Rothia sp.]|uniref:dioxygenase family protein n=1 Tax=uncultured Rothia sp. TaxID=316088 RepID=UPI0032165C55
MTTSAPSSQSQKSSDQIPVAYLSHGAPPLADDTTWTAELAQWGRSMPKPKQILMISAHWENAPITVSSTQGAPLVYDFWGFPQKYYDVTYDAPVAPELAQSVAGLLSTADTPVYQDQLRGLDHGAYVPLVEMYPDADIPVLQMSLPTLDPVQLFDMGRKLAPLRDEGTLIVGSGFTTHNMSWVNNEGYVPAASSEFDHWASEAVASGDLDSLFDFATKAPAAQEAHPRTEHWAPLYVALGAANPDGAFSSATKTAIDGFWLGMSKRSWQLD